MRCVFFFLKQRCAVIPEGTVRDPSPGLQRALGLAALLPSLSRSAVTPLKAVLRLLLKAVLHLLLKALLHLPAQARQCCAASLDTGCWLLPAIWCLSCSPKAMTGKLSQREQMLHSGKEKYRQIHFSALVVLYFVGRWMQMWYITPRRDVTMQIGQLLLQSYTLELPVLYIQDSPSTRTTNWTTSRAMPGFMFYLVSLINSSLKLAMS